MVAARRGEALPDAQQLFLEHLEQPLARAQDVQKLADALADLLQLVGDLGALELGQAVQAQLQDRLGLTLREAVGIVRPGRRVRHALLGQMQQWCYVAERPVLRRELLARARRIGRCPDQGDDRVEIGDRHREAEQDVRPLARARQIERRAPCDHLLAELEEQLENLPDVHLRRPAARQGDQVDAERDLQRRVAEQLVEDDLGVGVALDLDHHAGAVAIGFVADLGDALELPLAHQLAHPLLHAALVDLVGYLGDDDRVAVLAHLLDVGLAAHHQAAAAGREGLADAGLAEDDAAGREIGTRDQLEQALEAEVRIIDQGDAGVDHLAQIVRRHVGRHADRDAARTVDQKVGELRRQDGGLPVGVVVVRAKVDRVLVDVGEQRIGRLRQARLGVAHRRRRIAVHRAEIALAVDQRQAHGEILRHAHQRIVDRIAAMGVVLAHHVADDARALAGRPVVVVAALAHGVEDAPVHRLEAVAHVRQRARHDHAHGVVEVRALHLLLERDGLVGAIGR